MSLVVQEIVFYFFFTISRKLDYGVVLFSGYYKANGSAYCKNTGIVKKRGLIIKNWSGNIRQR